MVSSLKLLKGPSASRLSVVEESTEPGGEGSAVGGGGSLVLLLVWILLRATFGVRLVRAFLRVRTEPGVR